MKRLTLKDIRPLVKLLEKFLKESEKEETRVFLDEKQLEETNGIIEPLYMTNLHGKAVIVHYATEGDWTKSVLIPADNFPAENTSENEYSPADEALEWFFKW